MFLDHPWLRWSQISEIMTQSTYCDSQFILNFEKSINLKTRFDAFVFIQNDDL